jgi:transcriptional regulator with XRE-family HTH domain
MGVIKIMTFSDCLLRHRGRLKYSQQEMTVRLSWLDDEFKDLSLVTYSRWERNVNIPSIKKILKILIFFKEDLLDFYINPPFKPSMIEEKAFNRFLAYYHYFNDYWALCSYGVHEHPVFTEHDENNPFTETEKIQESLRKFIKISKLYRKSPDEKIALQKRGVMKLLTCKSEQGELLAHTGWILFPDSKKTIIINSILNGGKEIIPIQKDLSVSTSEPSVMFMRPILHFSREWFDFVLNKIISTLLLNSNIKEIILPTITIDGSKELLQFGFNVVKTECSAKNLKQNKQKGLELRIMRISSVDLLSNYGLNMWFKEYQHKKMMPST